MNLNNECGIIESLELAITVKVLCNQPGCFTVYYGTHYCHWVLTNFTINTIHTLEKVTSFLFQLQLTIWQKITNRKK